MYRPDGSECSLVRKYIYSRRKWVDSRFCAFCLMSTSSLIFCPGLLWRNRLLWRINKETDWASPGSHLPDSQGNLYAAFQVIFVWTIWVELKNGDGAEWGGSAWWFDSLTFLWEALREKGSPLLGQQAGLACTKWIGLLSQIPPAERSSCVWGVAELGWREGCEPWASCLAAFLMPFALL